MQAYLRLDKDLKFDKDWKKEMARVSEGLADQAYCEKMEVEAPLTAQYLQEHGVELVLLEFDTNQHFVFPKGGGHAIINCLLDHMKKYDGLSVSVPKHSDSRVVESVPAFLRRRLMGCNQIMWETEGVSLLLHDDGSIRGAKVRGTDGRLKSLMAPKVMLSCGGFEGNQEMLSKYVGNKVTTLPLV